jgi:two-component system, cell cycle response regulator DivK
MPRAWVVEDHDLNFELVDFLLGQAGWEVVRARDGAELAALLSSPPPDVVLLDLNLPDGSGLHLVPSLRAHAATRDVAIVAVTAHAMSGDRERLLAAGCDAYIAKPLDPARFLAEIEAARDRSRW